MQPSERNPPQNHKLFVCFQSCFNKGRCGSGEDVTFFKHSLIQTEATEVSLWQAARIPQGGFFLKEAHISRVFFLLICRISEASGFTPLL